jgi:glycosyltransferase involved in cell wall biosynthesis
MGKRIVIILPDLRGGGAERVSLDLANAFSELGHSVEFVLMQAKGDFLDEAQKVFDVQSLGITRARQLPFALAGYLRKSRPDALLAAMWPITPLAALGRALAKCRCRLMLIEHGVLSLQYGSYGGWHRVLLRTSMALGYRAADVVAGVSDGVAKDMAMLACMQTNQLRVLHNPIPARPAPSSQELMRAEEMWGTGSATRILTVGSFKKVKNHPLLLRAFARLATDPGARLMMVGKGEDEAVLRGLAAELGIAQQVIFAGFHADPTPFYRTANLFVLSSDSEGFGNVIVEALASGLQVVATDCPAGPAEILANGQYGRLAPVGDVDALAAAMCAALADDYDQEVLRKRAADFSPVIAAKKYLALLFPAEYAAISIV